MIGRYDKPRDQPFYWWGPAPGDRACPSLRDLVLGGRLTAPEAALVQLLFERGMSIFVISLASGAGKSTLLKAAVEASLPGRRRIYLRGAYETFDFLDRDDPARTCLLVNEISPHLPVYLWGPGVLTFLQAARMGYQLAATAHAPDVATFVHMLTAPPLTVPVDIVAEPKVVVTIEARDRPDGQQHTLTSVVALSPGASRQAVALETLAERSGFDAESKVEFDAAARVLFRAGLPVEDWSLSVERALDQLRGDG